MMKQMLLGSVMMTSMMTFGIGASVAMPLNMPVPDNAVVQHNGLDWAWAAPCAPVSPSCGAIDLSYQVGLGWHLPSIQEFLLKPAATAFRFKGANVSEGGVSAQGAHFSGFPNDDAACAAPFFSTTHVHCDWSDGINNLWWEPGKGSHYDTLVVRVSADPVLIEPLGLGLLALVLCILGIRQRGRRR